MTSSVAQTVGYQFQGKTFHPNCLMEKLGLPPVPYVWDVEVELGKWAFASFSWDIDAPEWDDETAYPQPIKQHDADCVYCAACHFGLIDGQ